MRATLIAFWMLLAGYVGAATTAKDIQDKADSVVAPLIASVQTFQGQWILTHKDYWQGIATPTTIPQDGADTMPSKNVKPVGDKDAASWADIAITMPTTLPCSIAVINQDGPKGKGYTVVVMVTFDTQTFYKSIGSGSEKEDTAGAWMELIPIHGGTGK